MSEYEEYWRQRDAEAKHKRRERNAKSRYNHWKRYGKPKMTDEKYQGWGNRATWNCGLWINNQFEYWKAMDAGRPYTVEGVETFVRSIFPQGETPDGISLDDVLWDELCESFNAD